MASTGGHFNQCLQSKPATTVYTLSISAQRLNWFVAGVQSLNSKYGGVHSFCVGHRAYHMIGLDRLPLGTRTTFLQLCIHDQDELNDRMALRGAQKLNRDVMQALQAELHLVNPFVRRFKAVNHDQYQPEFDLEIQADIGELLDQMYLMQQVLSQCFMTHQFFSEKW